MESNVRRTDRLLTTPP